MPHRASTTILLSGLLAAGLLTGCAGRTWRSPFDQALDLNARQRAALYLGEVDGGTLQLIDFEHWIPERGELDQAIRYAHLEAPQGWVPVTRTIVMTPAQVAECKRILGVVLADDSSGMSLCHEPHHFVTLTCHADGRGHADHALSMSVCLLCDNVVVNRDVPLTRLLGGEHAALARLFSAMTPQPDDGPVVPPAGAGGDGVEVFPYQAR